MLWFRTPKLNPKLTAKRSAANAAKTTSALREENISKRRRSTVGKHDQSTSGGALTQRCAWTKPVPARGNVIEPPRRGPEPPSFVLRDHLRAAPGVGRAEGLRGR